MKNKILIIISALGLSLALQTGCETGAYPPKQTQEFDLENREPFVLLDKATQNSVTCTGIQQRTLEDGRLEVTANVRNRIKKRIQVQINCVFKDEQGFSTGDETPWINLILDENAQESVKFVSMNNKAKKFTIRVRQAR
ncbi:MAG TPA: YcfL family protein [Verrucomicrobiota bacterium]|nr:YcfL family protein [Verrucomicrobiota bacterium]